MSTSQFKTWKSVDLGTGLETADDFRIALRRNNCEINNGANYMLGNPAFSVSDREITVDLVLVSFSDLGFGKYADRREVYEKARSLGLQICPEEVGPQLRLQFDGQRPGDKSLIVCIKPLPDNEGTPSLFSLQCNHHGELGLHSQPGCSGEIIDGVPFKLPYWVCSYYGGLVFMID